MLRDQSIDERAMSLESRKRRFLVLSDQPAVADNIGGKDRCHPAL
jgi:hypothetical protein